MSYEGKFDKKAEKFLFGLSEKEINRIINKFDQIKDNPFRYLEHYEGQDYSKIRIGDFRALVDMDKNNKILWIRVFDKRGRIYKR